MKQTLAVLAVAACAFVAAGLLAVVAAPHEIPPVPTAEQYEDVTMPEARRGPLADPPSILERGAAPPDGAETSVAEVPPAPQPKRIRIPDIQVDAEVVEMGIATGGALDSPEGPMLVAWYGFTGHPGGGGNAVMSGHVDYHDFGPAVFWELRELLPGHRIEVSLEDGTVVAYEVRSTQHYPVARVPMRDVLATTAEESLTIITCSGTFANGGYSHRLVLRAVRVG